MIQHLRLKIYFVITITKFYFVKFLPTSLEEYEEQFIMSRLNKEFLEHNIAERGGIQLTNS